MKYINKKLSIEKVAVENIAKKYKTPTYCYSYRQLKENIKNFKKNFKSFSPLICFSVKSNTNVNLIKEISKFGLGADVVSIGELMIAIKAGIKPKKIVFSGVGKTSNFTPVTAEYGTSTNATGSFTGNNITASSTNKMGCVLTYQDNAGTNALNTDIVLQLSADGGSNFTTATMTALPDFATGIKMAKVNDLSVTAGTSLKYKISFANQASGSKEARIRGVSLQY